MHNTSLYKSAIKHHANAARALVMHKTAVTDNNTACTAQIVFD